jgi:hypothetical protein
MAYEAFANDNSSTRTRWMLRLDKNLFGGSQPAVWCHYSDIENIIIEEAFMAKINFVVLDDYHIDFSHNLQISNNDRDEQRSVKRVVYNINDIHLREERFTSNTITLKRSSSDAYNLISTFILAATKYLNLEEKELTSSNETVVLMVVEKAALGIIEEGKKIGKKCEAEWIAKKLMERKNSGIKEVWKYCANLYSKESFLYKKVNETMRLIESDENEQIWRSKLDTFAPFCLLLCHNLFNDKSTKNFGTLYRGITLSPAEIDLFKADCFRNPKPERSFQPFTTCSRNRSRAEVYDGNTLLMMQGEHVCTVDLAPFSEYPHEEEVLFLTAACFTVERVEFDKVKSKHLFFLSLKHTPDSKLTFYLTYF